MTKTVRGVFRSLHLAERRPAKRCDAAQAGPPTWLLRPSDILQAAISDLHNLHKVMPLCLGIWSFVHCFLTNRPFPHRNALLPTIKWFCNFACRCLSTTCRWKQLVENGDPNALCDNDASARKRTVSVAASMTTTLVSYVTGDPTLPYKASVN